MAATFIGVGIVIGAAALALVIGARKIVEWCEGTTTKIEALGNSVDWLKGESQRLRKKTEDESDVCKNRFIRLSEAVLVGLTELNSRVDELEHPPEDKLSRPEEKQDES